MRSWSPSSPSSSRVAALLGAIAVVPFVAGAALPWFVGASWQPLIAQALSAYAAVVVSFIGAIHWGIGFTRAQPAARLFVWGVIPSLVAWVAVLSPPSIGLLVHAITLVICYLVDRIVYRVEEIADWLPLRLRLTIVAVPCCLIGAAAH